MNVLHQLEENEGFRLGRIEILISRGIVILEHHHRVLFLAHLHIVGVEIPVPVGGLAEDEYGETVGILGLVAVGVDGEEEVGIVPVGDFSPLLERHEHVCGPRHHHFDAWTAGLEEFLEAEGYVQIDVALVSLAVRTQAARILASVSGIDTDGPETHSIIVTQRIML